MWRARAQGEVEGEVEGEGDGQPGEGACELVSASNVSLRASRPSAVVRCSSASSSVSYMFLWSLA